MNAPWNVSTLSLATLTGVFLLISSTALCTVRPISPQRDGWESDFRWHLCDVATKSDEQIDAYLFAIDQRTPKVDKTGDFTWKDAYAAQAVGMSLKQFVLGLQIDFKRSLYCTVRALEAQGYKVGFTSLFRDNFRQWLAAGQKNAPGYTYHGGDKVTAGHGYGLAVDVVSLMGTTRAEQLATNHLVWKWIDKYGDMFGIGRPYLDRDAPHVTPLSSPEYTAHHVRSRALLVSALLRTKKIVHAKRPLRVARR